MSSPLIATDALEARLAALAAATERNTRELAALRTSVEHARLDEARIAAQALTARVANLEQRLLAVEGAVTLPALAGAPRALTVAEALAHVHGRVVGIETAVQDRLASRDNVQEAVQAAAAELQRRMDVLREDSSRRDAVEALSEACERTAAHASALESLLAQKADKTDLARLHATARELQTFAAFKESTLKELNDMSASLVHVRTCVDAALDGLGKVSGVVTSLAAQMNTKANSSDVSAVTDRLRDLAADVRACATAAELGNVAALVTSTADRLRAAEASTAALSSRLDGVTSLAHTHTHEAATRMRAELDTALADIRAQLSSLTSDLDSRAYVSSLESTDESVRALSLRLASVSAATHTAMRFVDWFATRGQDYEYNAAALERAMNELAVGNRARVVPSFRELLARHDTHTHTHTHAHAQPSSGGSTGAEQPTGLSSTVPSEPGPPAPVTGTPGIRIGGTREP